MFNCEKSREIRVFRSDKLISNFNVLNNIKITLHNSVYMRTSGEKARISDEAERVQSVSYSHIAAVSKLRPAGQMRPAKPFHPARKGILPLRKNNITMENFSIW